MLSRYPRRSMNERTTQTTGMFPYRGTSSVVVALDFARPRSRANLRDPGVWYFAR